MADSDRLTVSVASSGFLRILHKASAKIKSRISNSNASESRSPSLPYGLLRRFSLSEIKAATGNFSRSSRIGQGIFGCVYKGVVDSGQSIFGYVYKGVVDNGSLLVAVKRFMPRTHQAASGFFDSDEFRMEALLLCQLRHPHIIELLGFCWEDGEQILVYEYMSNGELDRHLFNPNEKRLSWRQRLEICIAVACGLHYLHTGLKRVVIHRCVNTSTILMDDKRGAKMSAFSMSKLGPSTVSSKPLVFKKDAEEGYVGKYGYIAPEYISHGEQSTKSDVFSFGVVLLEVLSGRRVTDFGHEQIISLIPWCRKNIENGTAYEIVDPFLQGKVAPASLNIFLQIADSCLAWEADERPVIAEVEMTLERALDAQSDMESRDNTQEATEFSNYEQVGSHLSADSSNLVKWNRSSSIGSTSHTSDEGDEIHLDLT